MCLWFFGFSMRRFLIDSDVNQKAIRTIPERQKGFDFLFPEPGSFKSAQDTPVRKIATTQGRVLVTGDKDFSQHNLKPHQVPSGVVWLRPPRAGQKQVAGLLERFCTFLKSTFPDDPYNFVGKIVEVSEHIVLITDAQGITHYPL